jgi:hypothetical protein
LTTHKWRLIRGALSLGAADLRRYRDPSLDVGDLLPGQTLFAERIVEVFEGRSYSWQDELDRRAKANFFPRSTPARRPVPTFNANRSLRRV